MNRLLILGASVRAAAQSACHAGWQVTAADLFLDRDLSSVADCVTVTNYPRDLARIRAMHAAMPVMYTGALENYPSLLDQFQSCGVLLGNDPDTVRQLRDPFRLRALLDRCGITFPTTRQDFPTANHGQWLRKPTRSAGGFQIQHCRANDCPARDGHYYQKIVNGVPCSACFVAANRRAVLLGVTDMLVGCAWSGARDFVYSGSITRKVAATESRQWVAIGNAIAEASRATGLFGVDAVIEDGQVIPVEVNPRYTASMEVIERLRTESMVGMHIEACLSGVLPQRNFGSVSYQAIGKLILYARSETRFPAEVHLNGERATLADVPQPNAVIAAGQPVATLILHAESRSRLPGALRNCAKRVYDQLKTPNAVRSR